jgi:hypothetical protein
MDECEYQRSGWPTAAEAAVQAVESSNAPDNKRAADVIEILVAREVPFDSVTAWMAWSFFEEPIWIPSGGGELGKWPA